jgi:hypothetical protein
MLNAKNYLEWMMETGKIVNIHIKAATSHVISHFVLRATAYLGIQISSRAFIIIFSTMGRQIFNLRDARACAFIFIYNMYIFPYALG